MNALEIAKIAYEANRAYCQTIGDDSFSDWENAPEWQKETNLKGVTGILDGSITGPEKSHESWLEEKRRTGWHYGPVKNAVKKEHPCFVDYRFLPAEQRIKDDIFFAIVKACGPSVPRVKSA